MITIKNKIIVYDDKDLIFPFEGKPYFPDIYNIDIFPCYPHDKTLVTKFVLDVEKKFPIKFKTKYYIFPFETEGRTNGWAESKRDWSDKKKNGEANAFEGKIYLSGKRIPIIPTMSKYLVYHERGHIIDYWINYCRGYKEDSTTEFDREYARLRKIKLNNEYGARKWHTNIGEIIANDFRICVGGAVPEFWPHPVSHPFKTPQVVKFWKEAIKKYGV